MKLKSLAMLTAVVALAGLVGCGGGASNSSTPISTANFPNITGNWELTVTSTQAPYTGDVSNNGVYLASTGGTVSGEAMFAPMCSTCSWPSDGESLNHSLTGTIDADGNIVLTSQYPSPYYSDFIVTLKATGTTLASGTYTINSVPGSSTVTDQGTVTGSMIAPVNGIYSGTLVSSVSGTSMAVTATLSQTYAADTLGYLYLSGPVTITASGWSNLPIPVQCSFIGNSFSFNADLITLTGSISPVGSGSPSTSAKTISVGYSAPDDYGYGTLTLQ